VVCLSSAASIHRLSDETPWQIWYAVDRVKKPATGSRRDPVRTLFWQEPMMRVGVDTTTFGGVPVRITSPARTIADILRYRGKFGDEPAMKAMKDFVAAMEIARQIGCFRQVERSLGWPKKCNRQFPGGLCETEQCVGRKRPDPHSQRIAQASRFARTPDAPLRVRALSGEARPVGLVRQLLKGAMALVAVTRNYIRATRDMDIMGFDQLSPQEALDAIKAIASVKPSDEDSIIFDLAKLTVQTINATAEEPGNQITGEARVGSAATPIKIEISHGHVASPAPVKMVSLSD
jgi:hypothetical protein